MSKKLVFKRPNFQKSLFLAGLTALSLFGLYLVGIIPAWEIKGVFSFWLIYLIAVLLFIVFVFTRKEYGALFLNFIALIICLGLTLSGVDLILRPLLKNKFTSKPGELFVYTLDYYPYIINRYKENITYKGKAYGDLVAMSGWHEYRQMRDVLFETDRLGFRNYNDADKLPLDLILLGDSLMENSGVSQEKLWPSIFKERHGLNTYNLSMPSVGPWQELINLKLEFNKLNAKPDAILLWAIFTGNDLAEFCSEMTNIPRPANFFRKMLEFQDDFRAGSPIKRLVKKFIYGILGKIKHTPSAIIVRDFLNNKKMLFFDYYKMTTAFSLDDIARHYNYEPLKKVFHEMNNFAKGHNLKVAVVVLPAKEEVYEWVLDEKAAWSSDTRPSGFSLFIEDLSRKEGFYFLDTKPFLIKASRAVFEKSGEVLWWYDDTHWNDTGYSVSASIVYNHLLRKIIGEKNVRHKQRD